MRRTVKIELDADTADFLALARVDGSLQAIEHFINSLIRQESFRQGYRLLSSPGGTGASGPPGTGFPAARNPIEKAMLQHSGLLPWSYRK